MDEQLKKELSKLGKESNLRSKILFIIYFLSKHNLIDEEIRKISKLKIIGIKNEDEIEEAFPYKDEDNISIEKIKKDFVNFAKNKKLSKNKDEINSQIEIKTEISNLSKEEPTFAFVKKKTKISRACTMELNKNDDSKEEKEKINVFKLDLNFGNEDKKDKKVKENKEKPNEKESINNEIENNKKQKVLKAQPEFHKVKQTYITKAYDNLEKLLQK